LVPATTTVVERKAKLSTRFEVESFVAFAACSVLSGLNATSFKGNKRTLREGIIENNPKFTRNIQADSLAILHRFKQILGLPTARVEETEALMGDRVEKILSRHFAIELFTGIVDSRVTTSWKKVFCFRKSVG
jgi:hypothetical protein